MGAPCKFEKSYPSVIRSEAEMFEDLTSFLSENRITEDRARDIQLCVSEAFNNAALHGNRLDPAKQVKLRVAVNHDSVIADIIDEGQGGIASIQQRREPTALDETGRGVNLMYGRANDVVLTAVDGGGLSVRLIFSDKVFTNDIATKHTT